MYTFLNEIKAGLSQLQVGRYLFPIQSLVRIDDIEMRN